MKDHAMLFQPAMVRSLLDGRKVQTRRLMKPQPFSHCQSFLRVFTDAPYFEARNDQGEPCSAFAAKKGLLTPHPPIRINIGDRIWVREAWRTFARLNDRAPRDITPERVFPLSSITYEATETRFPALGKLRPSMFMPRWASRLTLTVTDVRVQRLQDISEADAMAEGIDIDSIDMAPIARNYLHDDAWFIGWSMGVRAPSTSVDSDMVCRASFQSLWDSINGEGAWAANPWVIAYSFSVHKCNIDDMEGVNG